MLQADATNLFHKIYQLVCLQEAGAPIYVAFCILKGTNYKKSATERSLSIQIVSEEFGEVSAYPALLYWGSFVELQQSKTQQ